MSTGSLFNAKGARTSARIAALTNPPKRPYNDGFNRQARSGAIKKPASKAAAGRKGGGKKAAAKAPAMKAAVKKAAVKKPAAEKTAVAEPRADEPQAAATKKPAAMGPQAKNPIITEPAEGRAPRSSNSPARARSPIRKPQFNTWGARKTKTPSVNSSGSSPASETTPSKKPNVRAPTKKGRAGEDAIDISSDGEGEVKRESSQSQPHIKSEPQEDEPPLMEMPQYHLDGPDQQQHLRLWIDGARLILQDIRDEPKEVANDAVITALLNNFQEQLDGDADDYDDNEASEEFFPLEYDRLVGRGSAQAALQEALADRERETDTAYISERGLDLMYQVLVREMRRQNRLYDLDSRPVIDPDMAENMIAQFKAEYKRKYSDA